MIIPILIFCCAFAALIVSAACINAKLADNLATRSFKPVTPTATLLHFPPPGRRRSRNRRAHKLGRLLAVNHSVK